MGKIKNGTRMFQSVNTKKTGDFELYNNQLNKKIIINSKGAKAIKRYYKTNKISKRNKEFFDELQNLGFICENGGENVFLGTRIKSKFILSNLIMEITDACNLNCIHCYGSFGKVEKPSFISFQWLKKQISVFNKMHINSISITGGESTCNKDFLKISLFLLEKGFEVCIFTNGLNYNVISELLQKTKNYNYIIKVSLDGFADQHNAIRGNIYSFDLALKTINEIVKYPNVQLFISTVVMEKNLQNINEFKKFISTNYPTAVHTNDLIFPSGEAAGCKFDEDKWKYFKDLVPELFKLPEQKKRKKRCSGGISQATLMPTGRLKICNAACDEQFYFKYNVFDVGLEKAWLDCGDNINYFRKERDKRTEDCRKCAYKRNCFITDCRVLAYAYQHRLKKSNPLSCYMMKEAHKNDIDD